MSERPRWLHSAIAAGNREALSAAGKRGAEVANENRANALDQKQALAQAEREREKQREAAETAANELHIRITKEGDVLPPDPNGEMGED